MQDEKDKGKDTTAGAGTAPPDDLLKGYGSQPGTSKAPPGEAETC
jgi:hypothetical protein